MSKVAIVYWSGTGNTEAMAGLIAEGVATAGGESELIQAADFSSDQLGAYDAIALGCPAMGDEELEEDEFRPMYDEVQPSLPGRKVAFFGSYDWNEGEWMDNWREEAEEAGVSVLECVIAKDYPEGQAAEACKALGALLAQ